MPNDFQQHQERQRKLADITARASILAAQEAVAARAEAAAARREQAESLQRQENELEKQGKRSALLGSLGLLSTAEEKKAYALSQLTQDVNRSITAVEFAYAIGAEEVAKEMAESAPVVRWRNAWSQLVELQTKSKIKSAAEVNAMSYFAGAVWAVIGLTLFVFALVDPSDGKNPVGAIFWGLVGLFAAFCGYASLSQLTKYRRFLNDEYIPAKEEAAKYHASQVGRLISERLEKHVGNDGQALAQDLFNELVMPHYDKLQSFLPDSVKAAPEDVAKALNLNALGKKIVAEKSNIERLVAAQIVLDEKQGTLELNLLSERGLSDAFSKVVVTI
jgi:hypothetical protein